MGYLGYLVVEKIDDETIKELEILVPLYGIGVMRIDKENKKLKTIFPAIEKENIDFNILNKLYVNEDIKKFIEIIEDFYGCNEKLERLEEDIKREFKNKFNEELS